MENCDPDKLADAFLEFVAIRIMDIESLAMSLDTGPVPYFKTILRRFDAALTHLFDLLPEKNKSEVADTLYQLALFDQNGKQRPWALQILDQWPEFGSCVRRQEIGEIEKFIARIKKQLGFTSLGLLAEDIGVDWRVLKHYQERGYLRADAVENLTRQLNEALEARRLPKIAGSIPLVRAQFRKRPQVSSSTAKPNHPKSPKRR